MVGDLGFDQVLAHSGAFDVGRERFERGPGGVEQSPVLAAKVPDG